MYRYASNYCNLVSIYPKLDKVFKNYSQIIFWMTNHNDKIEKELHKNYKTIAISLITIIGSLLIVFALWLGFGYIGPSFSEDVLIEQQETLRKQYNLPIEENQEIDPQLAQVPPSLREFTNKSE